MPKFAANLSWLFQEWSFLDRFAAAVDAGFQAVEFLFPYDHRPDVIAQHLVRNRLTLELFNLPPGDWTRGERGIAALPERRAEFRASVHTAMEYAAALGAPRIHVMAGIVTGDKASALAAYRDAIAFAAETAMGLDVLIEPINNRDIPGYFMNDFGLAEKLITELKLPNLKLQFDIYHRQVIHGDVIRGLEKLMPITGHIQIASAPGRNEPLTGELDDLRVLHTIDRLGYPGQVGCEYKPLAGTLEGLGWMKRV